MDLLKPYEIKSLEKLFGSSNIKKNLSKVLDNKSKLNILLKNINKNILAIRTILKLTNTYPYNIFNEPKEINIINNKKKLIFPYKDNEDFRYSNVSLYSVTPLDQAIYTLDILLCFIKNPEKKILTEANGCIGGNTWIFAKKFKKVNVIELSKLHFEILKHNMALLHVNNINYYNGNCIDYIFDLKNNVLFFDPPWGGISYKDDSDKIGYMYKHIFLSIDDIVTQKYFSHNCDLIMLKLPLKYNMLYIKKNNKFKYYYVFTIRTAKRPVYKLVVLTNKRPHTKVDEKIVKEFHYKQIQTKIQTKNTN